MLAMNHYALDMLRSGSYGEAVAALKLALKQVQQGLLSHPPASTKVASPFDMMTMEDVDEHDEEDTSMFLEVFLSGPVACHGPGTPCCAPGDYHLIDSGLLLSGLEADLLASNINQARATAVLCYNLAMVYHLAALHGPQQHRRGNFQRALSLYNLVAHTTMLGTNDATNHDSDALIRMLVWNNKGHVHSCLQQLDQVQDCADSLGEMIVDDGEPWILGTHLLLVQLNVLLYSGKRNPAPAA